MSSALRTTTTPVGYFVLAPEVMIDGSSSGLYELSSAAVYANDGTVSTPAVFRYVNLTTGPDISNMFSGNSAATSAGGVIAVTLKDLGKTEYGAYVTDLSGRTEPTTRRGPVDLRKVQILGGARNTITRGEYVNQAYWVSLGTNLRSADPTTWNSSVDSSVALIGKLL